MGSSFCVQSIEKIFLHKCKLFFQQVLCCIPALRMGLSLKRQTVKNWVLALNESQSQTSVTFSEKDIFMAMCIYANNPK